MPVALDQVREEIRTMSEVEQEVCTFKVDYRCDHCPDGVMRPTGIVYDDVPPLYPHYCATCGYIATYNHRYPRIVTRTKEADPAPTDASKAKELLEQECRVTEEMLQRRVTL
jgi:hypothetical protein